MLDPEASKTVLRNLFRRTPAVELGSLRRALKTPAYMSVVRRLTLLGYFTSYTHCGRYYTLREVPQFDEFGLWHYGGIGFCRAGTLKAALVELVEKSEAGRTHQELQDLLRVRAHNKLLENVRAGRLERKQLDDKRWLYLSADASRAAKQWARRQAQKKRSAVLLGPLSSAMTVEVLVYVLQSSRPLVLVTPEQVVRRLHHQGVSVPLEHVHWVFERYELGKKGGPDSARSRR
ncbi:MAG: hypothetical protein HW418_3546 [Anaerolineales bacterium]|nr:hypothetical protein [Anaerolineales bacterium]